MAKIREVAPGTFYLYLNGGFAGSYASYAAAKKAADRLGWIVSE